MNRFDGKPIVKSRLVSIIFLVFFLVVDNQLEVEAQTKKGFNLKGAIIPVNEIMDGGPPRDGIPSIDHPEFSRADQAKYPEENARVLGVYLNGIAKAYPIGILNYHEIVNDFFGAKPVVITYCPLCGSGIAFYAKVDGKNSTFGVSGLLYNSDVLLYDRETESLWSQIMAQAVTGSMKGSELEIINTINTTWKEWKHTHPHTLVLSTKTGYVRNYHHTPYAGYDDSESLYFPVKKRNRAYHPKEKIIGVEVNGSYKAYPFSELEKAGNEIEDSFNGKKFRVLFDSEAEAARIVNEEGLEIPSFVSFWFAWAAFHKKTEVFTAK